MIKKFMIFASLASMVFLLSYCAPIIKCERVENGIKVVEKVVVQRHPEKQYNDYVKTTDANLKASINVLEKVKIADLDLGTKTKVTELRDKLDQFSTRQQNILKASYGAIETFPCDKDARKRHFDLLQEMSKENSALETLKSELDKLSSAGHFAGADENKIKEILSNFSKNSASQLLGL